ncbi:hypothetical protein [Saccharothrix sp. NRRL B-16314]|uniref:hypothetical protein n=1 Tax=Saccharothrix sp. NRRL B-16314 TaxID=1463825 RepID=UPI000523F6F6|nr:hypothetical protein [Saccharothrix sp. NRRL B-16314]
MSLAREPDATSTAKTRRTGRGRVEPDIDPATAPVSRQPHPAPPGVVRSLALALQRTAGNGAATALVRGAGPTVQRTVGVVEEPSYVQSGVLPGEKVGNHKNAEFDFTAKFDPAPAGTSPHPLEVRQDIRWDKKYEETAGGPPPHFGTAAAGEWHEDRFPDTPATDTEPAVPGTRYGHRSGPYANPFQERDDLDKYVEHGQGYASDRLIGEEYVGSDSPKVLPTSQGQFDFRLTAVDMSKGGQVVATSEILTVDWNDATGEGHRAEQ